MTQAPNKGLGSLNGRWEMIFKLSLVVGPMIVTTGLAAQGWVINRLSHLDEKVANVSERISVMEGNRFSSAEGLKVWEAIASIREEVAVIPKEVPPKWFADRVDRMSDRVDVLTSQTLELARIAAEMQKKKR